jgi:MFS superfamily sulfate permease-like transporter
MAFVESIAAARAFRSREDAPVQPDPELVALGAANAFEAVSASEAAS